MIQCFAAKKFSQPVMDIIVIANDIVTEYQKAGFDLTLRQLFYQFVARGHIANSDHEYKRLGSIINDARMAGEMDWDSINDRTRFVRKRGCWASPREIVDAAARGFHLDRWKTQDTAVEVWIEKDALIGVIENICTQLDVLHFSCRGYVSQSTMYEASQRILDRYNDSNRPTVILHLGDHDPSGIDMTRDIQDRLDIFCEGQGVVTVKRIALTMAQVKALNPPPNPAKLTDVRSKSYVQKYGDDSWELDAIDPANLVDLVRTEVEQYIDRTEWEQIEEQEKKDQAEIMALSGNLRS